MSKLRRHFEPGLSYFVTFVTFRRLRLAGAAPACFRSAIEQTRLRVRFSIPAWVLLPDHVHLILADCETDPADIIRRIKTRFSSCYRHTTHFAGKIWQPRYWDHMIRDDQDYRRHVDYIHYNPVKHGLVRDPKSWPHSTIVEYVKQGMYGDDWGQAETLEFEGDFGE